MIFEDYICVVEVLLKVEEIGQQIGLLIKQYLEMGFDDVYVV